MDNYGIMWCIGVDWQCFLLGLWWEDGEFGLNCGPLYFTIEWVYIGPTPTGTA